jgi:hypothetical protein
MIDPELEEKNLANIEKIAKSQPRLIHGISPMQFICEIRRLRLFCADLMREARSSYPEYYIEAVLVGKK